MIFNPTASDFAVYWTSFRLFLEGRDPYDQEALRQIQIQIGAVAASQPGELWLRMWYPPWTLPLLAPWCVWSFQISALIWFLSLVSAPVLIFAAAQKFVRDRNGGIISDSRWRAAFLYTIIFFLPVFPTTLLRLQIDPLLMLSLGGFWYAWYRGKDIAAGLALVPLAVKPHLFLLFALGIFSMFVRARRIKIVYAFAGALFILGTFSYLMNPLAFSGWYRSLGMAPVSQMTSDLSGLARDIIFRTSAQVVTWPMWVLPIIGLVIFLWLERRTSALKSESQCGGLFLALSLLFAPYSHTHDHILLFPTVLGSAGAIFLNGTQRTLILAALLSVVGLVLWWCAATEIDLFWFPLSALALILIARDRRIE